MHSLFLKIFLWFWLASVLVSGALFLSTEMTSSRQSPAIPPLIDGAMNTFSQNAARAFERGGVEELNEYLAEIESQTGLRAALFDNAGNQMAAGQNNNIPDAVKNFALKSGDRNKTVMLPAAPGLYVVRSVETSKNQSLILYAQLFQPPFDRFSFSFSSYGLRILFVLLTAGLLCYWLARYLAAPVSKIRNATQLLAEGDLSVRVTPYIGRRRDELAHMARDFDRMAERIESLMTAQWRLLRDISHELRSPLARLNIGLALARKRADSSANDALDRIEQETEQLNEMINRLLELDRWEFGAEKLPREQVELALMLGEIASDADFEAKNQNRRVSIIHSERCYVKGVPSLIRSAVENVVRNAVRHTEEMTTIEIELKCEKRNGASQAVITVWDKGEGVPEEAIFDIFQPFYRVDDARDRESGGTGLGLAITERAVKLHQGSVTALNAPSDKGFVVEIRLPICPEDKAATTVI